MRELAGRDEPRGNLLLFAVCIAVSLVALALPDSWAQSFSATVRATVLRPLVFMSEKGRANNESRFRLVGIERSRDSLALLVQETAVTRKENDNLRSLIALRQRIARPYIAAEVLHRPTPTESRTVLIGSGKVDGVRQYDPVVSPEGLLGYVWQAGPRASSVMTWAHPEFRASAVTADAAVLGIVLASPAPDGRQPMLQLTGVPLRDSLVIGTVVFTAGLGGVYPRGIPIGRVVGMESDPLGYERIYRVAPFANPGTTSHVLVLSGPRDSVFLALPVDTAAVPRDTSATRGSDTTRARIGDTLAPPVTPPAARP